MFIKKTAIAIALATASTFAMAGDPVTAQPGVEIYGKLRYWEESAKSGTATSVNKLSNDGSRLGFKGTEYLGDGLSAKFQIETLLNSDAPKTGADTKFGDRQLWVGLEQKDLGYVKLGRTKHSVGYMLDNYDPTGNSSYANVNRTAHAPQGDRHDNGTYIGFTPTKNIMLRVDRSQSEVAGTKDAYSAGAEFKAGQFSLMVANYDDNATNKTNAVYAKYTFGSGTTVYAGHSDDTISGVKSKGTSVSIKQPVTARLTAYGTYGIKDVAGGSASDVKGTTMGLEYALSKRTSLRFRAWNEDSDTASLDNRVYAVGIEHNF